MNSITILLEHRQRRIQIAISQEVLSQLTQQEYLLLIGEVEMKEQIAQEITSLKKDKEKLFNCRKSMTLEAASLDPVDECDAETLLLLDKNHLLTQKISDQEERNKALTDIIKNEMALDPLSSALHPQMIHDKKGTKPLVITLDYDEENSA